MHVVSIFGGKERSKAVWIRLERRYLVMEGSASLEQAKGARR